MKIKFLSIVLILILSNVSAKDYLQECGEGAHVNWTKGEVFVTGTSILPGESWTSQKKVNSMRAAELDGLRRLAEIVNNIYVDSETVVKDFVEADQTIRTKVEGVIRNFTQKEVRFLEEGVCEIDITLPITGEGNIADICLENLESPVIKDFLIEKKSSVIPDDFKFEQKTDPVENQPKQLAMVDKKIIEENHIVEEASQSEIVQTIEDENESTPELVVVVKDETDEKKELIDTLSTPNEGESNEEVIIISGLVINAGGHKIIPALNPKIVSESGEEVYGFKKANRDFRKINGLVSYAADLDDAKLDKRVTMTPHILNAKGVAEKKPTIIIVSDQDAKKFMDLEGSSKVLNRCRVIIVVNDSRQNNESNTVEA